MPEVYVGVGSNIEPETHLKAGVGQLDLHFGPLRCSAVFRSPSYGFRGADFLNMVVGFSTEVAPDLVEQRLSAIEYSGGRVRRTERYVPRTLDLDLMLYGASVDPRRRLPRDDVLRFAFVLGPLAELSPHLAHPVTGVPLSVAWRDMARRRPRLERIGAFADLA